MGSQPQPTIGGTYAEHGLAADKSWGLRRAWARSQQSFGLTLSGLTLSMGSQPTVVGTYADHLFTYPAVQDLVTHGTLLGILGYAWISIKHQISRWTRLGVLAYA